MAADIPDAPTPQSVESMQRLIEPIRALIAPKVYGIDRVPERRALLVGNHNILGLVDAPLLCSELWRRGRMVRALGDHSHFKIPVWRDTLSRYGVIDGTRSATAELMRRGDLIMVFPGGGREVAKRSGERYKLIWKQRLGFARLAIEHGYPVVPFASVGAEHGVDVVLDADSTAMAPLQALLKAVLGTPDVPPVVRGIGLSPIPRPERQYYWFGEPIDPAEFGRDATDSAARALRERTATSIETAIEFLLDERESDPEKSLVSRAFNAVRSAAKPIGEGLADVVS